MNKFSTYLLEVNLRKNLRLGEQSKVYSKLRRTSQQTIDSLITKYKLCRKQPDDPNILHLKIAEKAQ